MHHKCYQIQLLFLIHDFLSVMPKTPQMQLFTASNDVTLKQNDCHT